MHRISAQPAVSPLNQIRLMHRSNESCFSRHGEAFVYSSTLRRCAVIMEVGQVVIGSRKIWSDRFRKELTAA